MKQKFYYKKPFMITEYEIKDAISCTKEEYEEIKRIKNKIKKDKQIILDNKKFLDNTDYIITKIVELQNESLREEYKEVLLERGNKRDEINRLELEIDDLYKHL